MATEISRETKFCFRVRVVQSGSRYLMIGVIDKYFGRRDTDASPHNIGYCAAYFGSNAGKYPNGEQEGTGFL